MPHLRITLIVTSVLILAAATRASAAEDAPLDIAMGAKVYAEQCWRCHELPDPAARDGRAWRAVSLHMRVFACLTRHEQQQLLSFLRSQSTVKAADAGPVNPSSK